MSKHAKNTPDYFDDYATGEGEEESIPAADYSRPSHARWESRSSVSDEESVSSSEDYAAEPEYSDDYYDEPAEEEYVEPVPVKAAAPVKARKVSSSQSVRTGSAPRRSSSRPVSSRPAGQKPVSSSKAKKTSRPPVKKKKKGGFGKGLGIYVIIMLAITLIACVVLWFFLSGYQSRQDAAAAEEAAALAEAQAEAEHAREVKRAPQLAFEAWYKTMDADAWTELWYATNPESANNRDQVKAYMQDMIDAGDITLCKGLDSTDEAPVFVVKNSKQEIARVTMTGSDTNWSVGTVEMTLKGDKSASIRVAVGSTVYCNGEELSSEYASEPESNFTYEPLADKLVNPVSWTTYTVSGMLTEPELTVVPPDGCTVTETAEGDYLLCLDDESAKEYQEKAMNFTRTYLYYYLSGLNGTYGNLLNVLAYVAPNSQAYSDLNDTYNGVIWNSAHSDIKTDVSTGGVVIWADNCYSVDVTYTASGMVGTTEDDYAATMRVYFTDTGSGFGITNFETL